MYVCMYVYIYIYIHMYFSSEPLIFYITSIVMHPSTSLILHGLLCFLLTWPWFFNNYISTCVPLSIYFVSICYSLSSSLFSYVPRPSVRTARSDRARPSVYV